MQALRTRDRRWPPRGHRRWSLRSRRRSAPSASGARRDRPSRADDVELADAIARSRSAPSFVIGGLVAWWRRPDNRTGRLMTGTGLLFAAGSWQAVDDGWLLVAGRDRLARRRRDVRAPDPGLPGRPRRAAADRWVVGVAYAVVVVRGARRAVRAAERGRLRRVRRQPARGRAERHRDRDRHRPRQRRHRPVRARAARADRAALPPGDAGPAPDDGARSSAPPRCDGVAGARQHPGLARTRLAADRRRHRLRDRDDARAGRLPGRPAARPPAAHDVDPGPRRPPRRRRRTTSTCARSWPRRCATRT